MSHQSDDLMAFEQAGAADYRKARSAGFPVFRAVATATAVQVDRVVRTCLGLLRVGTGSPLRLRTYAAAAEKPGSAEGYARAVGVGLAMAELGDVLE